MAICTSCVVVVILPTYAFRYIQISMYVLRFVFVVIATGIFNVHAAFFHTFYIFT